MCVCIIDVKLPPHILQKIQSYHSATNEILRHFWSSFDPYKADKNVRMVESLKKQRSKLKDVVELVKDAGGDVERCKMMLHPVVQAVNKALESSERRGKKRKLVNT
ncbi:hypothetical protein BDA99DRAFT_198166 [Phascolomyces articulosus]|uniref:Uncharacterized protein n=1 Tax=Phascolomyces articulosus TaxID=60185 RepID=A0AAD5PKU3_9FUNG|nr:hypothetical protein BDA99DRAFT_198166 [Phascolomyces articulosus]